MGSSTKQDKRQSVKEAVGKTFVTLNVLCHRSDFDYRKLYSQIY